jgi:biotin carboxylase
MAARRGQASRADHPVRTRATSGDARSHRGVARRAMRNRYRPAGVVVRADATTPGVIVTEMKTNIFLFALDDFQRRELATIRDAEQCNFYSLLDPEELVVPDRYDFDDLLERARDQLRQFDGPVHAIISHWDFPSSVMAPVLCREYSIPAPSLESVLKCEHKYWSRVEQRRSIADCIPPFAGFDPFDDQALERIGLDYPFWIKPIKSHSSQLGFMIHRAQDFHDAIPRIRSEIGRIGDAFDQALELVDLPQEIRPYGGSSCLAEGIVSGRQLAAEGSMFQGEYHVHGVLDMLKDEAGRSFDIFQYPSAVPEPVQQRLIDACETFLRHIGFDNGCFNAEFMWGEDSDTLCLIEFNTRISQSHSEMFAMVDGMSDHEVAIDVALGIRPEMPRGQGRFAVAAKCMIPHYQDGIVRRIPSERELQELEERFPGIHIRLDVAPGTRLATLHNQDSYRYVLGNLYLGADSHEQLAERYRTCLRALRFEFDPVPESSAN